MEKSLQVTKIFSFEMAHALLDYDGDCRNIHGHSYVLHVTVQGRPREQPGHAKDGMIIDFKVLKAIVNKNIIDPFDHALVLNDRTSSVLLEALRRSHQKIILTPYQPTCENILINLIEKLIGKLPAGVRLQKMKLYETAKSYVEWENRYEKVSPDH